MTLGYRLKKERERRKWSQKFVAEKIGITNTVLSNYERDYRDPDTTTLGKLADLYEISTDELLGRSNKL
ncbi:helix-turn-helix domain-containing protein, partial [Bacillus sp. D-CC]